MLLRQDQSALRRGFIDRADQHHAVGRTDQVCDEALFRRTPRQQAGHALLQLPDTFAGEGADSHGPVIFRNRPAQVLLVHGDQEGNIPLPEQAQQLPVGFLQAGGTVGHQHGQVRPPQDLPRPFHPQAAQAARIVESGRIGDDHRTQRQQLHGF